MNSNAFRLLVLVGALSCAHEPPAATKQPLPPDAEAQKPKPSEPSGKTETLAADTPSKTAGGMTFTAPQSWRLSSQGALSLLVAPENNLRMGLMEMDAQDPAEAVKAAWGVLEPGVTRTPKLSADGASKPGFEKRKDFEYETSPNEHRDVSATAFGNGTHWVVVAIDGDEGTLEKRLGQLRLVVDSLHPAGYVRESFTGKTAHPLDAKRVAELRHFLEQAMKEAEVPGLGYAIIDQGKVVEEGGLGVRELGKPAKVDANTLFMAASNTKGMTTLLLAKLVDEGKLAWDEPVVKVYPEFKLGDAALTPKVEVRHLICACTGMPRQDLEMLLEFANATAESRMQLLSTMTPTSKFGEVFQYSNIMASAAGYVGGHLVHPEGPLGRAYTRAMQEEVFTPLGMRSTTFDLAKALKANHASPHGDDPDLHVKTVRIDVDRCIVPDNPAGGVWTSAHDFARYALLELGKGVTPEGQRVVSEENVLARRKPQVGIGQDQTYGMGLMVNNRWGIPVVHHGGDLLGYHSDFFVLPGVGAGALILTNSDRGVLIRGPFMRKLLEVLYDGQPLAQHDFETALAQYREEAKTERKRLEIPPEAGEVKKLAAHYHSDALGDIAVTTAKGQTTFDFGEWHSTVASRKNDDGTLSFITAEPGTVGFEFVVTTKDGHRALTTRDGQHEYVFLETP